MNLVKFNNYADPRIMKVLLGLLGYSCKIHRKRSKTSCNRFSFSESDEHRFERSLSNEENKLGNEAENDHSLASTSGGQGERNAEEDNDLPAKHQIEKPKEKQADQTSGVKSILIPFT